MIWRKSGRALYRRHPAPAMWPGEPRRPQAAAAAFFLPDLPSDLPSDLLSAFFSALAGLAVESGLLPASGFLLSELAVAATGAGLSPAMFFWPSFLKSVSYQPPPDRRKPAAEICLLSLDLPQTGH